MTSASLLLVDDHPELIENLKELIEELFDGSLAVRSASSGKAALDIAKNEVIQVAIVDVHLPDINGAELVRQLREIQANTQVVVLTGDATVESAIAALDQAAFAYVLKPFDVSQFGRVVSRALSQYQLLDERDQLIAQIKRSEELNRNVVDRVPAFVVAVDSKDKICVWNARLEEVTGYTLSDMQLSDAPPLRISGTGKLAVKSGGHRLVHWENTEGDTESGRLRYAIGSDITGEFEARQQSLRTERLAAVGTLAAGLAHEVRNPLNSASLQLQVLERKLRKLSDTSNQTQVDSGLEVTHRVRDELRRLDELVNEFLEFARPRALNLSLVDLNQLLEALYQSLNTEANQQGINFLLELDPKAGKLNLDPDRFKQVLINLLRNAMEAVGNGGQCILRSIAADDEANVSIEVEDNGPGFPQDAPIFDAFFTTKDSGTGLGLAIVHKIISEHGGTINAHSSPAGTRFSIRIRQSSGS